MGVRAREGSKAIAGGPAPGAQKAAATRCCDAARGPPETTREPTRASSRRSGRAAQHPHQRPVAALLRLAFRRSPRSRDLRLPLGESVMPRRAHAPIDPGEILEKEFLEPHGSSVSPGEGDQRSAAADQRDRARHPRDLRRHRAPTRAVLRYDGRVLAQSADALRPGGSARPAGRATPPRSLGSRASRLTPARLDRRGAGIARSRWMAARGLGAEA